MIDFTPLFRGSVGFDRLATMLEEATSTEVGGYPPYNIELTGENRYRISMAVAGFSENELELEVKQNLLRVSGGKSEERKEERPDFLYQGIANRGFDRHFQLADYVRVENAKLENGLLHIDLVREVPEAMKPRRIEIRAGEAGEKPALEGEAKQAA